MPSPFPGMDPYLEDPSGWLPFHNAWIAALAEDLNRSLRGRYVARMTERVVVEIPAAEGRAIEPDVILVLRRRRPGRTALLEHDEPVRVRGAIEGSREWAIEIRDRKRRRVVTVIEILSPSNKAEGPGRALYLKKQREVLASDAHLVEVDLLRAGQWTVAVPESAARAAGEMDYLVSVSRAEDRPDFDVYPIPLRNRLPRIGIPLAGTDPDGVADLQALLDRVYDGGQYSGELEYRGEPTPPLPPALEKWARGVLRRRAPRKGR